MLTILAIIVILLIMLLAFAAAKPDTFSMRRSADLRASPERIFAQLNDFKNWSSWSPWEKMDPDMKRTYAGAASGKGAKYSWIGNKQVGEGNMEITKAVPSSSVMLDLNFLKPFKASNVTEFKITPKGGVTHLDWEMRGPVSFFMKIMHVVMNMDKMVGKDFERGLANLKAVVEK